MGCGFVLHPDMILCIKFYGLFNICEICIYDFLTFRLRFPIRELPRRLIQRSKITNSSLPYLCRAPDLAIEVPELAVKSRNRPKRKDPN